jgi:hypothetical protein
LQAKDLQEVGIYTKQDAQNLGKARPFTIKQPNLMTRPERLRAYRTNHWLACVAAAIFVPFFALGSYLTLIVHAMLAIALFLAGIGCVLISIAQCREARRHGRLIRVEESRKRITRI